MPERAVFLLDERGEFGERAARRLRDELIGWLTTMDADGAPQPIPVWFLWDGERSVLVYSLPATAKLRNIERNPRVSLNLDGNGRGGDIVVCLGTMAVSDDPPADGVPAFVEKYAQRIAEHGWTPASFAREYPVALRMTIARIRGH
jgi:PPOX class probable F420-dependent enzyme